MTLEQRWAAGAERNRALVARRADELMSDTRYDRLRTRHARAALVASCVACLVLVPAAYLALGSLAGLLAVGVGIIAWGLLRVSVRTIADLPDEYLDERQLAVRNASYVESYRWLSGLVALAMSIVLVVFVAASGDVDTWGVTLTWDAMMAVFWAFLGTALALPSMVLALNDRV